MLALQSLPDDNKCCTAVRQMRWPEGVRCPLCGSEAVSKHGVDVTRKTRQKYRCKDRDGVRPRGRRTHT